MDIAVGLHLGGPSTVGAALSTFEMRECIGSVNGAAVDAQNWNDDPDKVQAKIEKPKVTKARD